jgi:hypothetical protein
MQNNLYMSFSQSSKHGVSAAKLPPARRGAVPPYCIVSFVRIIWKITKGLHGKSRRGVRVCPRLAGRRTGPLLHPGSRQIGSKNQDSGAIWLCARNAMYSEKRYRPHAIRSSHLRRFENHPGDLENKLDHLAKQTSSFRK